MLKLAGESDIGSEKIETITYTPGAQDTGDLEGATHTIVPTARPAIGSAQYSASLTLPKPDDVRLVVKRIAARLNVNIAGLGTATHVYCSVRVDEDDANHELFNEDWTSTGSKLAGETTHSGNKATIFNLLKDGAAHTFYFLFWADVASQATIDVVELWEGVGNIGNSGNSIADLTHTGLVEVDYGTAKAGTGTTAGHYGPYDQSEGYDLWLTTRHASSEKGIAISSGTTRIMTYTSVSTDLVCINILVLQLRSEQ